MCEKEQFYLDFLKKHQPMLPDEELSEDELRIYDDARKYFKQNSNKSCIPLFLNSFGDRDGFGVYQLVEVVIFQFSIEDVLTHLKQALSNKSGSVQYWCAQIAGSFPSEALLPYLEALLYERDFDIKCATLNSLYFFEFPKTKDIIARYIEKETNIELINIAKDLFPNC